jgi:hypothetical protein
MASYTINLTPGLVVFGGEGSLDTSVVNGVSLQRTVEALFVVNGSNKKMLYRLVDGDAYDDTTFETPVYTTPIGNPIFAGGSAVSRPAATSGHPTASLFSGSTFIPAAPVMPDTGGGNEVQAATLYFNGTVDDAWTTVGNWWLDAGHTQAAGRLPAEDDSVVATANITASGQTVVDFTIDGGGDYFELSGSLTVTGIATFIVAGSIGTVNGNATFIDGGTAGTVNGDATFNNSVNQGLVTGDATFNDGSRNEGPVTGTATFTGPACNDAFNGGTAGTFDPDPPPSCV